MNTSIKTLVKRFKFLPFAFLVVFILAAGVLAFDNTLLTGQYRYTKFGVYGSSSGSVIVQGDGTGTYDGLPITYSVDGAGKVKIIITVQNLELQGAVTLDGTTMITNGPNGDPSITTYFLQGSDPAATRNVLGKYSLVSFNNAYANVSEITFTESSNQVSHANFWNHNLWNGNIWNHNIWRPKFWLNDFWNGDFWNQNLWNPNLGNLNFGNQNLFNQNLWSQDMWQNNTFVNNYWHENFLNNNFSSGGAILDTSVVSWFDILKGTLYLAFKKSSQMSYNGLTGNYTTVVYTPWGSTRSQILFHGDGSGVENGQLFTYHVNPDGTFSLTRLDGTVFTGSIAPHGNFAAWTNNNGNELITAVKGLP